MAKQQQYWMRMATDTATIAVFDPVRLRHRLDDADDWWSIAKDELAEINAGNMFSVNLGSDGCYEVTVHVDERPEAHAESYVSGLIVCESGKLFIGKGEQISAGGLEPDLAHGGLRIRRLQKGTYRVHMSRPTFDELEVWLEPVSDLPRNQFAMGPRCCL